MDPGLAGPVTKVKETLLSLFSSREKEFKTVWRIEKQGPTGYLAGTAHFFPYRFKRSLSVHIGKARRVLFEGPLDEKSLKRVVDRGSEGGGGEAIYEALDSLTKGKIKRLLSPSPPEWSSFSLLRTRGQAPQDPLYLWFKNLRPWLAFLQIWSQFLKGQGWKYSVDLEALEVANQLGKEVYFLETIEEQVEALEGVPVERYVNYLKKFDHWEEYAREHARHYLDGDSERFLSFTAEFPTRCPSIVENRDRVFFERMKVHLDREETIAFFGLIHMQGIKRMLREEGYSVTPLEEGK